MADEEGPRRPTYRRRTPAKFAGASPRLLCMRTTSPNIVRQRFSQFAAIFLRMCPGQGEPLSRFTDRIYNMNRTGLP